MNLTFIVDIHFTFIFVSDDAVLTKSLMHMK